MNSIPNNEGATTIKRLSSVLGIAAAVILAVLFLSTESSAQEQTLKPSPQSSCQCSGGSCSASQTCPDGYVAVCTCTATSCSSSCVSQIFNGEYSGKVLTERLKDQPADAIPGVLTKAFGKKIAFEPTNSAFRVNEAGLSGSASGWDILEFLSQNGKLSVNGRDLDFYRGLRNTLLNGGQFSFCTSPAPVSMLLGELSFLTGKRFRVISGSPQAKVTSQVKGNSLAEVLDSLGKSAQVTIVED